MELGSNSIFSYCIYKGDQIRSSNGQYRQIGEYSIFMSQKTCYDLREDNEISFLIIGLATCVKEELSAMDWLWKHSQSVESIIEAEKYLGGKYILFVKIKKSYYIIGDATCSIPVFYTYKGGHLLCSSIGFQLAKETNQTYDETLLKIRQGGDASHTMPFNYTVWKGIKRLLPNHYLDINSGRVVRFVNQYLEKSSLSAQKAAEITLPFVKRLTEYYMNKFSVACALTSGRDSRVVLAVLDRKKNIPIYTMKHNEFKDNTPDLVVPKQIATYVGLNYHQINDVELTDEKIREANTLLGEGNYSKRTLMLAHTIKYYFGKNAVINGDIIGQVGKCSLHRDIPLCFASPSYFLCKLHNYTREAKAALKDWMQDIGKTEEHINSFDLFSIENRMGVWAANENEIYNMIGQYYLNVFNSRSIIYEWTRVDRKERKKSAIHIAIIKLLEPRLLDVPFEPSGFFEKISKFNGITYLIASYLKHYIEILKNR